MYLAMNVMLMGALPILCAAMDIVAFGGGAAPTFAVARWFVFWSVGVRLLLAGVRQVVDPSFTSATIFRVDDPAALGIVKELGFGNLAIGVLGVAAIVDRDWVFAAAVAGGLYFGLAGVQHAMRRDRGPRETIAMAADIFVFAVLAACLLAASLRGAMD